MDKFNPSPFRRCWCGELFTTVWLCVVRVFEVLHFQTAMSQFVYSYFCFYSQVIKDELAALQRRTAVELHAESRIKYSFCYSLYVFIRCHIFPLHSSTLFYLQSQMHPFLKSIYLELNLKVLKKFLFLWCAARWTPDTKLPNNLQPV